MPDAATTAPALSGTVSAPRASPTDRAPGSSPGAPEQPPSVPESTQPTAAPDPERHPPSDTRPATTKPATPTEQETTTTAPPAPERPAEEGPDASITISNFSFQPVILDVLVGALVEVTNLDDAPHTWTADDGSWDSGPLGQGASFRHTFEAAGTYAYLCTIHPSMRGTVNVNG